MCYVCADCLNDPVLAEIVQDNLCHNQCSYCDAHAVEDIACYIDTIVHAIKLAVIRDYNHEFQEEGPYDQEDGCY